MLIFKCKMCGGDIQATEGATHGTCDFCGTTSTLPKASDERIVNLFNRANQQRQKNDFDKAMANYENILTEDATNAEAHWGVVLCRYGIEYVEDPRSHERIPTCHRVQYESILSDNDYLAALENAPDSYARELYENEAKKISEIQKGILAISNTEEPYDVFICYKETTDGGSRTKDSALAQDIYYQLEKEGYKTFFSRITLEGKLGQQYEPYIFAALNSAKVMLVIGTDPAYFNAVWVRNEWSRFLLLMKKDRSKLLIPCYKDMDAYDIPNELSMFQSQDMGKIGFIQDLIHGIKKVISKSQAEEIKTQSSGATPVFGTAGAGIDGLLKRAFIFLEDGDFKQAGDYCDRVLDIDPENARAYVGLLLAELKIKKEKELSLNEKPLDQLANYQKAVRYSDEAYRNWLEQCNQYILNRIREKEEQENERQRLIAEQQQKEAEERAEQERYTIYNKAVADGKKARRAAEYLKITEAFRSVGNYYDAPTQGEYYYNLYLRTSKKEKSRKFKMTGIIVVIVFLLTVPRFLINEFKYRAEQKKIEAEWQIEQASIEAEKQAKREAKQAQREAFWGEYANTINAEANSEVIKSESHLLLVEDIITFGKYDWVVIDIDIERRRALILSEKIILQDRHYNPNKHVNNMSEIRISWESSYIRSYLNSTFYYGFKENEKMRIVESNEIQDKIFILSKKEALYYLSNINSVRTPLPLNDSVSSVWTLRTTASNSHMVSVESDGAINERGVSAFQYTGIRPAMWISLD